MRVRTYGWIGLVLLASSSASAFNTFPRIDELIDDGVLGHVSGHEEITRQALMRARDALFRFGMLPDRTGFAELFLDIVPRYTLRGWNTKNDIIRGVYASDFPEDPAMPMDLRRYWNLPAGREWLTWAGAMASHALRPERYRPPSIRAAGVPVPKPEFEDFLLTQSETCYEARARITQVTIDAVRNWETGDRQRARFLLGHAAHTIQDSFSPEHGRRDIGLGNNDLLNICYYGEGTRAVLKHLGYEDRACQHLDPAWNAQTGDFIWIRTRLQEDKARTEWPSESVARSTEFVLLMPTDRESSLKHEARLARNATARFVFLLVRYLMDKRDGRLKDPDYRELANLLDRQLYEGNAGLPEIDYKLIEGGKRAHYVMPYGVLRCHRLQEQILPNREPTIAELVGKPFAESLWGPPGRENLSGFALSIYKALGGEALEREERRRQQLEFERLLKLKR